MEIKSTLKKTWHFLWEEDSFASWLVNVILAFLIVKFLIYPGLGLLLGTSFPVVAVVSGSMEHDGDFDFWWEEQKNFYEELDISKEEFHNYKFENGFNKGDLMVLVGAKEINEGDVIVFTAQTPDPIIHRVVNINADGTYRTKGDHNSGSRQDELSISQDRVVGKAQFRIPYLGWFKIMFVSLLQFFRIA